jgi:endonuclease/exonuclease/phosphatase family metal-dependent hydrolase
LTSGSSERLDVLRVMTFNIRGYWHPGDGVNQWHHREALNVATIRREAPHLIGFQEAQGRNLGAYKKLLPEYWYTEGPQYGNRPPHEWNAVFWDPARLQPIDSGGFWLSETPERASRSWDTDNIRSAAWVKFRCAGSDATFVHLNTHLDHVSEDARINGSKLIIERLADLQHEGCAAVLTGDFNAPARSPTYEMYRDAGFVDAFIAAGNSDDDPFESYTNHGWRGYPWDRPDDTPQRIDWILIRNGARTAADVRSCKIVRDAEPPVYPSDHYPVVADLEVF